MDEIRKKFSAEIRDVYSGDDLMAMVELGVDDLYKKKRIRLYGVDTPNGVGCGPDTEAGKVRSWVLDMVKKRRVTLTVISQTNNSWICKVEVHCTSPTSNYVVDLNEALIAKGFKFNREKGI